MGCYLALISVTIEGIAAKAKVAKTMIYRWWPTKTVIFMELYNELAVKTLTTLDTDSVTEDLRNLLRGMFKLFTTTSAGPAMVGMISEAQSNSEVVKVFQEQFMVHRRMLHALFFSGVWSAVSFKLTRY